MTTYKYTLNGVTKFYTFEQLQSYYRGLLRKQNPYEVPSEAPSDEMLSKIVASVIIRLNKYDGDPYGHIKSQYYLWRKYHREEQQGFINIVKPDGREV